MYLTDHVTLATGKTVTVTVRKPGGTFGAAAGAVTEVANGAYELAGNASDRDTLGTSLYYATASGCDPLLFSVDIKAYDPFASPASLVWDYLVSALGATTTVGGYIKSVIDAIKAKTDTLGVSTTQVISPVTSNGTVYLTLGDDYLAADGRSLDFTFSGMPSFSGGSCRMRFASNGGGSIGSAITGSILSSTSLRFEPTSAQTAVLGGSAKFEIEVTLSNTHIVTPIPLNEGKVVIAQQAT